MRELTQKSHNMLNDTSFNDGRSDASHSRFGKRQADPGALSKLQMKNVNLNNMMLSQ